MKSEWKFLELKQKYVKDWVYEIRETIWPRIIYQLKEYHYWKISLIFLWHFVSHWFMTVFKLMINKCKTYLIYLFIFASSEKGKVLIITIMDDILWWIMLINRVDFRHKMQFLLSSNEDQLGLVFNYSNSSSDYDHNSLRQYINRLGRS